MRYRPGEAAERVLNYVNTLRFGSAWRDSGLYKEWSLRAKHGGAVLRVTF